MTKDTMTRNSATSLKYVGLDVHKDTITVAVADDGKPDAVVIGTYPNDEKRLRAVLSKIGRPEQLRVCYEAGPCGYVIYRFLEQLKIHCDVVAPSLIPRKPGDRVKTDRRDARKLAVMLRSGLLTSIWVPDREHEALRDLVRAREDAVEDRTRARQRLGKFLLRLGVRAPDDINPWTAPYLQWLARLQLDHAAQQVVLEEYRQVIEESKRRVARFEREIEECVTTSDHAAVVAALQAMRGVKLVTAASIVAEVGDIRRFRTPRQLMAYAGMVPSEHSSGSHTRRGAMTKSGNAHLRRAVIESGWHYRHKPVVSDAMRKRQREAPAAAYFYSKDVIAEMRREWTPKAPDRTLYKHLEDLCPKLLQMELAERNCYASSDVLLTEVDLLCELKDTKGKFIEGERRNISHPDPT